MRFTIRDLLWLTVVTALAVAWWVDQHHSDEAAAKLRSELTAKLEAMEVQKAGWHSNANSLADYLRDLGFEVTHWVDEGGGSGIEVGPLRNSSAPDPNPLKK